VTTRGLERRGSSLDRGHWEIATAPLVAFHVIEPRSKSVRIPPATA
jgi:hypothetical protein